MAKEAPEIDLTKVKNIEAVETVEPGFEEKIIEPAKRNKTSKFDFTEPEKLPLPSGGRLYGEITTDEDVLNGYISMYPMGMKEEEILSTSRFLKNGTATRIILDRCIASNIQAKDLLLFDSNFLMFYLRKISYGDEYKFEIQCTNTMCERKFNHTVNISELSFEELPEDIAEPIVVELPKSKYTVKLTLPRLFHSEEILLKNANRKKATSDADSRLRDNIMITTLEVLDTEKNPIDKRDWEEFFEALPGLDTAELREKTTFSTGVDTLDNVVCPYCETDYSGTIPMGPEFFRF